MYESLKISGAQSSKVSGSPGLRVSRTRGLIDLWSRSLTSLRVITDQVFVEEISKSFNTNRLTLQYGSKRCQRIQKGQSIALAQVKSLQFQTYGHIL